MKMTINGNQKVMEIPFKELYDVFMGKDHPYCCDILNGMIEEFNEGEVSECFPPTMIPFQFYQQWVGVFNPNVEPQSETIFLDTFQNMEAWNANSEFFAEANTLVTYNPENMGMNMKQRWGFMREYRTKCFEKILEIYPNFTLTFVGQ